MKFLKRPTQLQILMVFMTMMLSYGLLFGMYGYISTRYFGANSTWLILGSMFIGAFLAAILLAQHSMRKEAPEAGQEEKLPEGSFSEFSHALSYVNAGAFAFLFMGSWFSSAVVPPGAKVLLGIVFTMSATLTLLNIYYSWLCWQNSRKTPLPAR